MGALLGVSEAAAAGEAAPWDDRVERAAKLLHLTKAQVGLMYIAFRKYEYEGDGRITIGDLCHNILQRPRDAFAEALLELVSVEEDSHIEFPEFVSLITNYLMMEKMEMYVRAAGAARLLRRRATATAATPPLALLLLAASY